MAVIVTTYNAPLYLAKVLDGYITQTRIPDELIVADDGSTAETAEVVAAFAAKANFTVRHVWQEDQGFRAAKIRNEAVKASSADYLLFTDGDCVPHPRYVEDHLRLVEGGWFVQGKRILVKKDVAAGFYFHGATRLLLMCLRGKLSGCHHLLRIPGFALGKKGLRGIKTCNFALSRKDFMAVNGFNEAFVGWGREDAELANRLFKYGLGRKDPLFSAMVFHLWHRENSRDNLAGNDERLDAAVDDEGFFCKNGLLKD